MSDGEHYWLFTPGTLVEVSHEEPAIQQAYMTVDEARTAAKDAGGNLDIFGSPAGDGGWRFVEHVEKEDRVKEDVEE